MRLPHRSTLPNLAARATLVLLGLLSACGKADAPAGGAAQVSAASGAAVGCGRVTVANMNWQSAEVLAQIDAFILAKGYGCQVELVPGDTVPTLTAMVEKGQPDVAPEAWVNAVRAPLDQAVKAGRLHYGARALSDGGIEGWWIPRYLADAHPGIKTIADALAHPELFPAPEAPGKGAVYNCPAGWTCQHTTRSAFQAWGAAAQGFVLVETGSAAGLDGSLAKAYERGQGWLGYYWAPTTLLGRYAMVKLDAGVPHDAAAFAACNAQPDCARPVKSDWARADVFTVMTDRFKAQGGPAVAYLEQRAWGNATVHALLAWMGERQATGADGARHFLQTQPEVWTAWVSPEAAARIQAALR